MLPVRKLNCSTLLTSTQKERKKEETGMINNSLDRYFKNKLFLTTITTTKYNQRYYNNSYTPSIHIKNHLQFSEIFELPFRNIWNRSCQVVALQFSMCVQ